LGKCNTQKGRQQAVKANSQFPSLLGRDRYEELNQEQKPFVRDEGDKMSLIEVIKKHEPTILLGVTGIGKLFTEDIIKEMAAHCERPIIFALSNPTDRAECTAEQAYTWTGGKCIFASGSPFPSTTMPDGRILFASQCNNFYLFPGLGLGASACGSKKVTDRMIYLAAEALAHVTPTEAVKVGKLFPPRDRIRDGSKAIATAVVQEAVSLGIATRVSSDDAKDIPGFVERQMYYPHYVPLIEKRTIIL
jgi:malate dehydrogenase (oxaloacetate-decarboxylating)(NADP+)